MEEQLSTKQAALALGVSESSVKRWCDRGMIPTIKTLGGHRRIPAQAFEAFVRDKFALVQHSPEPIDSSETTCEELGKLSTKDVLQSFIAALKVGDERACRSIINHWLAQSQSAACLADNLIAPTFRAVGNLWNCGDLEIFEERRGCEIISQIVSELRRDMKEPPNNGPLAIGASPEEDHYELPSQLIDLLLRQIGWRTSNLGCNLPLETVATAARKCNAQLVWLSVSHISNKEDFVQSFAKFYAELPPQCNLVIGGRALTDDIRPQLHYTAFCDNMSQFSCFAKALLNASTTGTNLYSQA